MNVAIIKGQLCLRAVGLSPPPPTTTSRDASAGSVLIPPTAWLRSAVVHRLFVQHHPEQTGKGNRRWFSSSPPSLLPGADAWCKATVHAFCCSRASSAAQITSWSSFDLFHNCKGRSVNASSPLRCCCSGCSCSLGCRTHYCSIFKKAAVTPLFLRSRQRASVMLKKKAPKVYF